MKLSPQDNRRFFAIELPEWLGLADKLWHLSKIYALGKALDYTYIHTPFNCVRSSSPSYIGVNFKHLFDSIFCRQKKKYKADYLGRFLGLEKRELNIDDEVFSGCQKCIISLDEIFGNHKPSSMSALREVIKYLIEGSPQAILCFSTLSGIYTYIAEIDNILLEAKEDKSFSNDLEITNYYWRARRKNPIQTGFSKNKIKILIHVRNGDTACFKVGNKFISVFAASANLVESEDEFHQIERKPTDLVDIVTILERVFKVYNANNFSVLLVSDGYKRSLEVILQSLLKRKIRLSLIELIHLWNEVIAAQRHLKSFLKCYNAPAIIGESKENLKRSIHAIAEADIVVLSSGGFAYWVHTFLRKNPRSQMIKIMPYNDEEGININNMIKPIYELYASKQTTAQPEDQSASTNQSLSSKS